MSRRGYKAFFDAAKLAASNFGITDKDEFIEQIQKYIPLSEQTSSILFVIDYRIGQFVYVSPNALEVEGYTNKEVMQAGPIGFLSNLHPLDADILMNRAFPDGMEFTYSIPEVDFQNLRISVNYRLLQKDGTYITMLQKFWYLADDGMRNPVAIIGVITNISDLYHDHQMFCKIDMYKDGKAWVNVFSKTYAINELQIEMGITERELQIIFGVSKGLTSKEIAFNSERSVETVNKQRKTILEKTGCQSMTEVVTLAIKNKWI